MVKSLKSEKFSVRCADRQVWYHVSFNWDTSAVISLTRVQTNRQKWMIFSNEFNGLSAIKQRAYTKKSLRSSSGDMKTVYKKANRLLGTPSPWLPGAPRAPSEFQSLSETETVYPLRVNDDPRARGCSQAISWPLRTQRSLQTCWRFWGVLLKWQD